VNKELASSLYDQLEDQTMERQFGGLCRHSKLSCTAALFCSK